MTAAFVLDLPQCETEAILTDHAARRGVLVERSHKLVALTQDGEGVRATVEGPTGPEVVHARWVVGCDGAHSTVRHALHITFEGAPYDDLWLAADVALRWNLPDDEFHAFLAPAGVLVAFALPSAGRARVIYDHPSSRGTPDGSRVDAHEASAAPTLAEVQTAITERTGLDVTVSDPRWLAGFRIHRRIASSYRVGRVFLAGDAAHIHSPLGGQGMNTGIQDAYNLGWKLGLVARGWAKPSLLDSYGAERRPIAAATVRGTDLATQAVTLRHPIARWARDRLAETLSGLDVLQQRGMRAASQIAVGYRGSAIVGEHRAGILAAFPRAVGWTDFGVGPRSGDRAPDVHFNGDQRLFDLLHDTRHALLLMCGPDASTRRARCIGATVPRASACTYFVPTPMWPFAVSLRMPKRSTGISPRSLARSPRATKHSAPPVGLGYSSPRACRRSDGYSPGSASPC